jgi:ubiquinone/menaquinone biosynthesis C-methylase UbiE
MSANPRPSPAGEARIKQRVQDQFAPVASAYVTSATHAHGVDLRRMVELAAPARHERLLDVATGGGHTALVFAPHLRQVIASDLTSEMLKAARQHITSQGATNVGYCQAAAEALPFANASFDLVTCRVAAHHFANVRSFVAEAARILRPGGRLMVSDHIGLEDRELDAFMDRFERWRDPSHVRAYSFTEWQAFCAAVGLHVTHTETDPREPYEFDSWTGRMRMTEAERDALGHWLITAPTRFREFFEVVEREGKVVSLRGAFGIIVASK